ncbi:transcription factor BHLH42-like isoform X2 [Salvia splendens]|uniref:transcription factor BHLH42-like isoform X2 n=1 Tax=Salvia splendens TaxID=180675 RepID=UPI001C254656|nr:transcription factor BHLH42-like isoform X2 [Salvia splendens]
MAEPPRSWLQSSLQAAVQAVQWTYSLFWQFCPQQGVMVWSDGCYNWAIKTRKTVQAAEESEQLRELYECLAGGEAEQRSSAALSPEDLTESEWFYLMCVSFSFRPGIGLPGKAYVDRQQIWLTRANKSDSTLFSRTILAESAKIQTVVCIPLLDGVVELGTTEKVQEDIGLVQRVKGFFVNCQNPKPPRLAPSGHSTSNPTSSSPGYYSLASQMAEEEEEEVGSDSDQVGGLTPPNQNLAEAMHLDLSDQDIRVGSPDHSSNNLGSNFHHLAVTQRGTSSEHGGIDKDVTVHRWPCKDPIITRSFRSSHSADLITEEDAHYSQTVSSLLENQSNRWSTLSSSSDTAFSKWLPEPAASTSTHCRHDQLLDGGSQWVLKYVLFTLPLLQAKPRDASASACHGPQDELSSNHVLAERRRREKLNERFVMLRSMVPFVTKMDKASILTDTIEYLKQLKWRIQQLGAESERNVGRQEKSGLRTDGGKRPKVGATVEVSIIESDALVEISCVDKSGMLLDLMQMLRGLGLHVTTAHSSINNGTFNAELRAKLTLMFISTHEKIHRWGSRVGLNRLPHVLITQKLMYDHLSFRWWRVRTAGDRASRR